MTEATGDDNERARPNSKKKKHLGELEKAIRKPIRPHVIRPHGFAVPDDPEAVKRENAQMQELHEKAVATARREKLKLLLRRYSLAEDDYEGLALALAIEHEPGFQVIDRQIAKLYLRLSDAETAESPSVPAEASEIYEPLIPLLIKDGELIDKTSGRPIQWSGERLLHLLEAVTAEKKKSDLTKDLDALGRLARQEQWRPPATHRSNSTRGQGDAWIHTLRSRLHDAKRLKRRIDALNAIVEKAKRLIGK
jgi:hypothetical protein